MSSKKTAKRRPKAARSPWYSTPRDKRKRPSRSLCLTPEASEVLDDLAVREEQSASRVASEAILAYARGPRPRSQEVQGEAAFSSENLPDLVEVCLGLKDGTSVRIKDATVIPTTVRVGNVRQGVLAEGWTRARVLVSTASGAAYFEIEPDPTTTEAQIQEGDLYLKGPFRVAMAEHHTATARAKFRPRSLAAPPPATEAVANENGEATP